MAIYVVKNQSSALSTVEFTPVSDGNFSFFTVKLPMQADAVKQWLTSKDVGQEIVAETLVNGQPVLITHGDKNNNALMETLKAHGDEIELYNEKKKLNPWAWRGNLSNLGQTLNLISAYRKPGGIAMDKMAFAGLNFAASYVNATFGGQKSEDDYQLRHLKENINRLLGKHLPEGVEPHGVDEDRAEVRKEPALPKTIGQKFHNFIEANSVRVGEIGLRYLGSIAMVFPVKNWGSAYQQLRKGSIAGALNAARNKDTTNFYTGATYLVGKTVGLFSKVPDPYNPKPHTTLDTIREKYLFRLSSLIEAGAASILAVGNFKQDQTTGKRDYIGGAGGTVLTAGLLIRLFADFGKREVDMDELYAHTTDTLAKIPPDKLPQLIADSAAALKEHFSEKPIEYGKIYTRMMTDLYRYHHIALDNLGTQPEERVAAMNPPAVAPVYMQEKYPSEKTVFRQLPDRVTVAETNFVDKVTKNRNISLIRP